jgi:hypothetical protein
MADRSSSLYIKKNMKPVPDPCSLLAAIEELCDKDSVSQLLPRYTSRAPRAQIYRAYRFPAVFKNAMWVLKNECVDAEGAVASGWTSSLSPSPEPLSHRVDDWMLQCMRAWETYAWQRSDRLERLSVMRVERMRCIGIMQRRFYRFTTL